ncbi:hypothetical protein J4230_01400 [Candidatus Woesearchaeota archaeon]|nr:hypothetical protein [Candidatus Woesearchaeota archaeon]
MAEGDALLATGNLFLQPLYRLWQDFVSIFPSIVVAFLLLILGYFIGWAIGHAVKWLLDKAGLDNIIRKSGLTREVGHTHVPNLLGELVKWFVFIIFLQVAVDVLNLNTLSNLLNDFVRWLPNVLFAIIIFFAGIALAHYIGIKIREHTKMRGMLIAAGIVKVVILYLVLVIALHQIGIDVDILENAFLILLGALGLGFALAMGIGLGLGLRDHADEFVEKLRKNF